MRSRVVQVDTDQVTAARLGQETLRLNLFDDAAVAVQIDRVRPTRSGYFITGRPEGFEWGEVRLVVNGSVMVGTVVTPQGKYTIRFGGAGRHVIRQVDPSAQSLERDVAEIPPPSSPPQGLAPDDPLGAVVLPSTTAAGNQPTEDGSEVRVLVAYTPALQREQGGAAGIQALIDLMIQSANQAFEDSGIDPRLVLARAVLVDYVEEDRNADLDRLRSPDDGYMDEVHMLRNEHAADLVHLLTGGLSFSSAGIAYRPPYADLRFADQLAFAVTKGTSEEVFTHEIGHNFGLNHDRYLDHANRSIHPYAFGYINDRAFESGAPEITRWRTVMAYNDRCSAAGFNCPALLRFSNPEQNHEGDPLGVPADDPRSGVDGPADARLTINNAARWIGSYRSESCTQFAVTPQLAVVPVGGSEAAFQVETGSGCIWEASSESAFLTVETEVRHAGPGFVTIQVQPNETGEERNGTVSVAGMNVEFRQLAIDAGVCSRTFHVARAIAGDATCDEVDEQRLSEITSLHLDGQDLTALEAGDFEGLENLVSLRLGDNRLGEVPEGLFAGLSNLEFVSLNRNQLTELPADLFDGLSKLRSLELALNDLEALPDGLFDGLSGLRTLNLAQNELSELPDGVFVEISGLFTLLLEHNQFSEFPAETFAGLSSLGTLSIGNNSYDSLPAGLFSGLDNLQGVSIGSSRLSSLPENIFSGLPRLKGISLQGSPLTELPQGIFSGLSSLESVIILHTVMPSLPEGVFSGLTSLESLRLRWNQFESLPPGVFAELGALRYLDLEENQLSDLPDGIFSGLTSLETLLLAGNPVDPFQFELTLEKVGEHEVKAVAPLGAPLTFELPLTVSDGGEVAGGANAITIPAGAVESVLLGLTRVAEDIDTATVDIASLPNVPSNHSGYVFAKDPTLPLEFELPEDVSPPVQVSGLEVARGAKSLRLSWAEVSGADGYKVQWKSGEEEYDEESRQAVVAGGDTRTYTITGLTDGTEYTVRVLATRSGADDGPFSSEVVGTTRSGDPDVNGDGVLDGDDAQIMYYAYRFANLVGDGETGGTEASRQSFLAGYSGLTDPSDEQLRAMVARANAWRTEGLNEGGDINADGMIDGSDARAMYNAYAYTSLLGDGDEGGTARFRLQLLGPLAGTENPTDEDLKAILRRANELREAYSQ